MAAEVVAEGSAAFSRGFAVSAVTERKHKVAVVVLLGIVLFGLFFIRRLTVGLVLR